MWHKYNIPRQSLISWLALKAWLITNDKLVRWGKLDSALCVLYNKEEESIDHLFFKCDFSCDVWNSYLDGHGTSPCEAFATLNKDRKVMLIELPINGETIPFKIL